MIHEKSAVERYTRPPDVSEVHRLVLLLGSEGLILSTADLFLYLCCGACYTGKMGCFFGVSVSENSITHVWLRLGNA